MNCFLTWLNNHNCFFSMYNKKLGNFQCLYPALSLTAISSILINQFYIAMQ